MQTLLAIVFVLFCTSAAAYADIYEWRDAAGNRHFTNSLANVPSEQQPGARVVVTASTPEVNDAGSHPVNVPAQEPRSEAQVVYDYSNRPDPYSQGIQDGIALARALSRSDSEGVLINGPLAVANANPYVNVSSPYPYSYYYPGYPLVTTSFDRGRSRHRTLRMLLQDQFQLDRDGPYVYESALPPPLGPNLNVILPRGLPHDRVRNVAPQGTRVTTR